MKNCFDLRIFLNNFVAGGVGLIWERPDVKQVVSIGDNLINNDDEEYSIAGDDGGNTLIILSATKKHDGQYKCKIATQENIEVTHTVIVNNINPHHEALEVINNSDINTVTHSLVIVLGVLLRLL